jgi:hypothetical protein
MRWATPHRILPACWHTREDGRAVTAAKTTDRTGEDSGGRPLVLLAIEPRSYAQAIGGVIAELRPELDVLVVDPEDLVSEMERRAPALVLCGEERPDGCSEAVRWAEFRPYEEPEVVRVDGRAERFPGLELEDLLGLVDRLAVGANRG